MTHKKKKYRGASTASKVLIAAVLISILTVTVSASELVRNWFIAYFSDESDAILSQEQIEYLEENEQHIDQIQTQDGWSVTLRSAITDGIKGYIMLGITAPEDVSLADIPGSKGYYGPGNDFLPKSPDAVLSCSAYPDFGGVLANIGSSWQEDGDGLKNTINYIIDVAPDVEWAEMDPFGPDAEWHIHIVNLVHGFPEQTILAEGTWNFDFVFEKHNVSIDLLAEPMKIQAWSKLGDGTETLAEVTVTSMVLRPFGVTIYYGDSSDAVDYERTSISFTDSEFDRNPWFVVMKDGSKVELYTAGGNPIERYKYLEAKLPVALENADYLLLPDGTMIPIHT